LVDVPQEPVRNAVERAPQEAERLGDDVGGDLSKLQFARFTDDQFQIRMPSQHFSESVGQDLEVEPSVYE
jgi:hypothetical protein